MADIFLKSGDTFTTLDPNAGIFGNTGNEKAILAATATGATVSQTVETVQLAGAASSYLYQQQGNQLLVFSGATKVATITLQNDADGTQVQFADGTFSAKVSAAGLTLGAGTVPSAAPGAVNPGTGNPPPAGATATLTERADTISSNIFEAPRGFTPGGTDQVNTLNDDDKLTGTGTADVLNFTYVENADIPGADVIITPTLIGIETVNVAFATQQSSATLDLQDSTGITNVNLSRISTQTTSAGVINLAAVPALVTLSNSNAPSSDVYFTTQNGVLAGAADTINIGVNNVRVNSLRFGREIYQAGEGAEVANLISTGNNEIGVLQIEDNETLNISGTGPLTLGSNGVVVRAGSQSVEALSYSSGFDPVFADGSLTKVDASKLTAKLDITLGSEVTALADGTSGSPVDFTLIGTAQDDVIRLTKGFDTAGDKIDGGAGNDTLFVYSSVANGTVSGVETLDVRSVATGGADTITVDASLFTGLNTIRVRNEGQTGGAPNNSQDNAAIFVLNKLTAPQAAALQIQHSVTESNALEDNRVVANLAASTGSSDLAGITWKDQLDTEARGINQNPRFNFAFETAAVESITLNDTDTESNTVLLGSGAFAVDANGGTSVSDITGTVTLTGGQVGKFLNLDANGASGQEGLYGLSPNDFLVGAASGDITLTGGLQSTWNAKASVQDIGAANEVRLNAAKIDASTFVGDVIVRVSDSADSKGAFTPTGAQTITLGTGNDTVIFDKLNDTRAGLTISDIVDGGTGSDTLAIDGDGKIITLGASEWTNVKNFETIRLVGNNVPAADALLAYGDNSYNLRLTNDLINNNGEAVTGGRRIAIINDNNLNNEATGVAGLGAANRGVTIDARTLNADRNFSYNGEEGANQTADRFILADPNINGLALIDGGFLTKGGFVGNNDVLEVRNSAIVTVGDLLGTSNVGTIEFTNDTATIQQSVLELDTATIERLVNTTHTGKAGEVEVLTIKVSGNPLVPAAATELTIEGAGVTGAGVAYKVDVTGAATVNIAQNGANGVITGDGGNNTINSLGNSNDTINGGAGNDTINAGGGNDVITGGAGLDTLTGGAGADIFTFNFGDNSSGAPDVITDFSSAAGDRLDFTFGAASAGGTALNYAEGAGAADYAAALGNADAAFVGGPVVLFAEQVGTSVFVFYDENAGGVTDHVIELQNTTLGQIAFSDIV